VRKSLYLLVPAVLAAGCHLDKLLSDGSGGGAPPHGSGTLKAAAATSGSNLPTGYTVTLDSSRSAAIGINDSITATDIAAGSHRAALDGVPANCSVSGANPRSVKVLPNDTVRTTFSVACTAPATHLAFDIEPPKTVVALTGTFTVEVTAENDSGGVVPGFTGQVTLAIGNDGSLTGGAHLGGTTSVNLVNGIATFPDLTIDKTGVNYTLTASVSGLPDATSSAFSVVAAGP
jgi:hypothetical protein